MVWPSEVPIMGQSSVIRNFHGVAPSGQIRHFEWNPPLLTRRFSVAMFEDRRVPQNIPTSSNLHPNSSFRKPHCLHLQFPPPKMPGSEDANARGRMVRAGYCWAHDEVIDPYPIRVGESAAAASEQKDQGFGPLGIIPSNWTLQEVKSFSIHWFPHETDKLLEGSLGWSPPFNRWRSSLHCSRTQGLGTWQELIKSDPVG